MEKALLIAEKPDMAAAIEHAYSVYSDKKKRYDITFASASGHLLELWMPGQYQEAWKKWNLDILPMIPVEFKKNVKKPAENRIKEIKNLIEKNNYSVIINACDSGREGENIFTEIYNYLDLSIPELRLWVSDLTDEGICKAFDNLLLPQNNLKKAAQLREQDDFLIGINGTRAVALSTGEKISVGRVMSMVLAMVVRRDMEKEAFVPEEFYECQTTIKYKGLEFEGKVLKDSESVKFGTTEEVEELLQYAQNPGTVLKRSSKAIKKKAPLLHSLLDLQKEAFSNFGFSPDHTLAIAQKLYEMKLITYPRTDSRYLSDNVARELKDNLSALMVIPALSPVISDILANPENLAHICSKKNKYVDNSKLTDHHAIIPTKLIPDFTKLNDEEIQVYILVARRLVAIFMEEQIVEKTTIICAFGGINTISEGSVLVQEGFTKIFGSVYKDNMLPDAVAGEEVEIVNIELVQKKSSPLSHYNYSTLLDAMEGATSINSNYSKGIGTAATRAETIKKLIENKYIKLVTGNGKKHIEATNIGRHIYELIKDTSLVDISFTVDMESKLKEIEEGVCDYNDYYDSMIEHVNTLTKQLKSLPKVENPLIPYKEEHDESDILKNLKCPFCKKPVYVSYNYFYCSGRNDKTCDFINNRTYFGAVFELDDIEKLLSGYSIVKTFTWKSGKKGRAKLSLVGGKYKFDF